VSTPDLVDIDPVSSLILAEAGELGAVVLVVDDRHGVLCRTALERGSRVLAACDDLRDELELPEGVTIVDLTAEPDLREVSTVLWRLPKAVGAVEDVAEVLALRCRTDVCVFAGARVKYLVLAMNDALRSSFDEVSASRGVSKSRVLRASRPHTTARTYPRLTHVPELGLTIAAHGGVFSANRLDAGTRLLLRALRHEQPVSGRALDLGCGTGVIAATLALLGWDVAATDTSSAAVASTRRTAAENQLDIATTRADGIPDGMNDLDLVVCNPPFHVRAAKDSAATFELIEDAGRAVRPGGELWLVYNAHLPYLPAAFDHVGPTRVVVRDNTYVVTCSTRR
jgi:16S rRNA (guanine1207-N2)-methyltransferase